MLPTFLGIGSAKCGTTWLHRALGSHPHVFVAARKEINYFYKNILWHGLDWYEAHFIAAANEPRKPVRGEISPFYSKLARPGVEAIRRLVPELRVVYIIRNPIERAWSQALFEFGYLRKRRLDNVPVRTWLRYFERARTVRYSAYAKTIDIWTSVLGREAVHVARFDRLQTDACGFLSDILEHIGASRSWSPPEEIRSRKVGETRSLLSPGAMIDMPPIVRWYLATQWREPTRRLNERLDGQVSDWVQEMDELAGHSRVGWRVGRRVNRLVLSMPERVVYRFYDAARNACLSWRYRIVLKERDRLGR